MSAIRSYKNGAGGSSGADLAVLAPTYQTGNYWYVGNSIAGNSDSNAGTERAKPLSTSAQANTNAAAGDTIVWLAGHNETLSSAVTFSHAGLNLVGEGTGLNVPRFTCNVAGTMWNVTGSGILLDNLYFPPSQTVQVRVSLSGAFAHAKGLQFDCGANDTATGSMLLAGSFTGRIVNTRFTAVASQPAVGLAVTGSFTGTDLAMDNITLDGGSFGWSSYAFNVGASSTLSRLRVTRLYQLNGSHVLIPTGSTGVIQVAAATGDSRIDWTV